YKSHRIRFQIWDLAGQAHFRPLNKSFFLGAQGALVLFDLTNEKTMKNVQVWAEEFWRNNGKGKSMPIIVIGNKKDLRGTVPGSISTDDGMAAVARLSSDTNVPIPYLETSAKNGENIELAFETLTDHYLRSFEKSS
ncbi:MAG TPA: GTP-binding protein, partial [Candidatus Hodarchaeales archaeon]|nr:GTP-binding protein [Candidatus Hodarchaeales archaeon]